MKSIPSDPILYDKVKRIVYSHIPVHSAYRSGLLVQWYKKAYNELHNDENPYKNKEKNKDGLNRWFKEEWTNQNSNIGYETLYDIYRPNKRISKDTPKTFSELTEKDIESAMIEKYLTGRVKKF